MEEANQEVLLRAGFLDRQIQEMESNLGLINEQINELGEFAKSIDSFEKSKEKEIFSSIGRGIYAKANLQGKDLFVDAGSGVIVKKSAEETKEIIEANIKRLIEAKIQLQSQIGIYLRAFEEIASNIEKKK